MKLTEEQLNQVSGGAGTSNYRRITQRTQMYPIDGTGALWHETNTVVELIREKASTMYGTKYSVIKYKGKIGDVNANALGPLNNTPSDNRDGTVCVCMRLRWNVRPRT